MAFLLTHTHTHTYKQIPNSCQALYTHIHILNIQFLKSQFLNAIHI